VTVKRIWPILSGFGLCFLLFGLWKAWNGVHSELVTISPDIFVFRNVEVGVHPFDFWIRNDSDSPLTLVGCNAPCGRHGCAKLSGFPRTIQPGKSVKLEGQFSVSDAGQIDYELEVWTDSSSVGILTLTIRGYCTGEVQKNAVRKTYATPHAAGNWVSMAVDSAAGQLHYAVLSGLSQRLVQPGLVHGDYSQLRRRSRLDVAFVRRDVCSHDHHACRYQEPAR
jgi:Protein of unknown function (DUF1573)